MDELKLQKEFAKNESENTSPETSNFIIPDTAKDKETEQAKEIKDAQQAEKQTHTEKETKKTFIATKPAKKDLRSTKPPRDEIMIKVEKILEEDLREQYEKMSPVAQQEFKLRGEETADKIREMLLSTHLKVKKVFKLIVNWLSLLPGINRFFLEQEAKIKTDKIIAIKKQDGY